MVLKNHYRSLFVQAIGWPCEDKQAHNFKNMQLISDDSTTFFGSAVV